MPFLRRLANKYRLKLEELFGIDFRSLALFRICLGLILLGDLAIRATDLKAHYTDYGVLPRGPLTTELMNAWFLSLHLISGEVWVQSILFLIAGVCALFLLIGYKTRLATVLSWILLISLQSRNGMVIQGGDIVLRMMLFWSLFLPLGAVYSVDQALNQNKIVIPRKEFSMATAAILLQVVMIYVFTAALKNGTDWQSGQAIYDALQLDHFVTPIGTFFLHNFSNILSPLTTIVLWFELVGTLLFFIPIFTGPIRTIVVGLFILFHIGLGTMLSLGFFPFVNIMAMIPFLPSWFWDHLFTRIKTAKRRALIFSFDADCGFCKNVTAIFKTFFLIPETIVIKAQSDEKIFTEMQEKNSWVIVDEKKKHHFYFDGFIVLCAYSPILWPFAPFLSLKPCRKIGDYFYHVLAKQRKKICVLTPPPKKTIPNKKMTLVQNIVVAFLLVYIILWNSGKLDTEYKPLGYILRIDQIWDMFAPQPFQDDGWYVMPAQLHNGTEIDLWTKEAVTYKKPTFIAGMYKNFRWRKYMRNLWAKENSGHRLYFGKYMCRAWNDTHTEEEKLQTFKIIFMKEMTVANFGTPTVEPVTIWSHDCNKKE